LSAVILDGLATAKSIKSEIKDQVVSLKKRGINPGLGTILVGDDPGSHAYVSGKHRDCSEVGIDSVRIDLPGSASKSDILKAINDLNSARDVTGYIIQLPLPVGLDSLELLEAMDPDKDADGLHPVNLGRLVLSVSGQINSPIPCTPAGIVELLQRYDVSLEGKQVAVLGRGVTVGRPLGLLLTRKGIDATVTLLHSASKNIPEAVRNSDIVVAAVGVPNFVKRDWVQKGAAVLDVGITRVGEGSSAKLIGDVAKEVSEVAGFLSPNPGGVGPMTRAMLLKNVVQMASRT
jgi:methylenetetrahydrofolate dehydrogenase (NADP+) / methenyltetrahydrofolate cyclohydrolase